MTRPAQDPIPATPPVTTPADAQSGAAPVHVVDEHLNNSIESLTGVDVDRAIGYVQTYAIPVAKALILLLIALVIAGWVRRLALAAFERARLEQTLAKFLANLARWLVLVLAGLSILNTLGVETTSFAAVVAAVGFAIGLALSGSLSNVAAGVMLLIFRPFKVGDSVTAGGVTGIVDEIELFQTSIDTADNRRIIVPNSAIFGSTIENVTFHPKRRADVSVTLALAADPTRARALLTAAAQSVQGQSPGSTPTVTFSKLSAGAYDCDIGVWAPTADYIAVRERLILAVRDAILTNSLPTPRSSMDVRIDNPAPSRA